MKNLVKLIEAVTGLVFIIVLALLVSGLLFR